MCGALERRDAVRWRLLRPFRRRFSFSGAAPEPPFWVAGSIVSPNREHLHCYSARTDSTTCLTISSGETPSACASKLRITR